MEITHIGHACFRLKGKQAVIVTDPFDPEMVGIKIPPLTADAVTVSHQHQDHNYVQAVSGSPVLVQGPGEYEIKGIRMIGIPTFHDDEGGAKRGKNTIFRIEIDGVTIVHCGDVGHLLKDKEKEYITEPDILLVPVGGEYTISAREAAQLVASLTPKIVIPMHYNSPKLNQKAFSALAAVDEFLKEMGKEGISPQPKLVTTKDKLPAELTVVVLE